MDDCMLKRGFDLTPTAGEGGAPSGSIDVSQYDMDEFDAAYTACMKSVGEPPVDDSIPTDEEIFETQLVFAKCMRDAGYDYPDPVQGDGGMSPALGPEVDPTVIDACSVEANEVVSQ